MTVGHAAKLFGLCALFWHPSAGAAEQAADAVLVAQRLLDGLRETSGVPGMAAAVWQDGRIVWDGASGQRDIERGAPVTKDTLFRLASVSKLITVAAAAKLAEQGRIDLSRPVKQQLPWLGDQWPAITPSDLAAHVSGLPHYQNVDENRGAAHYADGRAAVAIFAGRDLLVPPGTVYSYSS